MNKLKYYILNKPEVVVPVIFGILACLLYGPITKQTGAGSQIVEDISRTRSINTGLLGYYASNDGRYPETLQDIVDQGILEQDEIELWELNTYYINGYDAGDGESIILFTSTYAPDEKYNANRGVIAYVDGSVEMAERHELETLLAQEIVKLRAKSSK